jgi:hypothetical protein
MNSFSIFSVNFIPLPQEVRGIFVIKAAVEMQNNLPFCEKLQDEIETEKFELNKFHTSKKDPFY